MPTATPTPQLFSVRARSLSAGESIAIYSRRSRKPKLSRILRIIPTGDSLQITTADNPSRPLVVLPSTLVETTRRAV